MTEEQLANGFDDEDVESNSHEEDSSDEQARNTVSIDEYKNLQSAFTRSSQEVGALKQQLAQLEQARGEEANSDAVSDALAFLDSDEVSEEIDADPSRIVPLLKKAVMLSKQQLESEMVQTLRQRDEYYHKKFQATDPVYQSYKDDIEELRKEPAFERLGEDALIAIVKKTRGDKGDRPQFRGNPGGGRVPRTSGGKSAKDIRSSELYKKIYGG
jgi:hypothetical protein